MVKIAARMALARGPLVETITEEANEVLLP